MLLWGFLSQKPQLGTPIHDRRCCSNVHSPNMEGDWAQAPAPQVQPFRTSDPFPQSFKNPVISEPTPVPPKNTFSLSAAPNLNLWQS